LSTVIRRVLWRCSMPGREGGRCHGVSRFRASVTCMFVLVGRIILKICACQVPALRALASVLEVRPLSLCASCQVARVQVALEVTKYRMEGRKVEKEACSSCRSASMVHFLHCLRAHASSQRIFFIAYSIYTLHSLRRSRRSLYTMTSSMYNTRNPYLTIRHSCPTFIPVQ
jgi:hypothetical protein